MFKVNKLVIIINIWFFALSLQTRNQPVGITGEKCRTVCQSECTLDLLQIQAMYKI